MKAYALEPMILADYDAITGLPTDGYFRELLKETWVAWEGAVVSIIGLDIVRFERFLEQYGQETGNECLKRIKGVVEDVLLAPGCRMARYGPQRFLILLPGFTVDEARLCAQDLETGINGLELGLTVSFTVVSQPAHRGASAPRLLSQALASLDAKR